jgi:hypothetical protein
MLLREGVVVSWWIPKPRNAGHIQRSGVVLSFVPAGVSIRGIVGERWPEYPPDVVKSTDVSKRPRYLVRVDKPVRIPGQRSFELLAPEATKLHNTMRSV